VEEEPLLGLAFLLPEDGYSCDIVRGVPSGLIEFLTPLLPVCRLTPNPSAAGYWTIFFQDPMRSPSAMSGRSFATLNPNTSSSAHHPSTLNFAQLNLNSNSSTPAVVVNPPNSNQAQQVLSGGGSGMGSAGHPMSASGGNLNAMARGTEPEVQTIKLQKMSTGLGLSIVAAKVRQRIPYLI
jgi:hypothetical protein